jgi:hypothetical protein
VNVHCNRVVPHYFTVYGDARIDPGSVFRLVVHVDSYDAEDDYGVVNMEEQQHDLWFDRNNQYSLAKFHEDLSTKMYWGPSQTLAVWVVDNDSASQLKLRRDEHVHQMVKDRWEQRVAYINVEVVRKGVVNDNASSAASRGRCVSGVTNGHGDTYSFPSSANEQPDDDGLATQVDWATLTIQENPDDDGLATQVVDEQQLYVAMGFLQAEATAQEEAARQEVPIPTMTTQMRADMAAAAMEVDDTADEEPLYEWDRDNPDMSVGTCYPSMDELRLAVRQHAIMEEFELNIEHSDKERFRGCCAILGCEWIMRARTQHDGSVKVYFLHLFYVSSTLLLYLEHDNFCICFMFHLPFVVLRA